MLFSQAGSYIVDGFALLSFVGGTFQEPVFATDTITVTAPAPVPEPATVLLLLLGLTILAFERRHRAGRVTRR